MDSSLTFAVFVAVMGVGFVAWLCSLAMGLRLGTVPTDFESADPKFEPKSWSGSEFGARTVRGRPEKLCKTLARAFTQLNAGGFSSLYQIVERTDDSIVVEKTGPLACNQPTGLYFSEAKVKFEYLGNDTTRINYELGFDRLAKRMRSIAVGINLFVGLPVLLVVGMLVWKLVVTSDDRHLHWQVLQTLQIVHAIWPPFLVIAIYAMGRKQSKTYFSNLLSALELAE
jgi:hypothetical protein